MPVPNYQNSVGWLALQLQAQDLQRQQAEQAAKEQQAAAEQERSFASSMEVMKQNHAMENDRFNRDLEMARLAGEVAAGKGEPTPNYESDRLRESARLAGAHALDSWRRKKEMEELRQVDDRERAALREKEIVQRVKYQDEEQRRKRDHDEMVAATFGMPAEFGPAATALGYTVREAYENPEIRAKVGKYQEIRKQRALDAHAKSGSSVVVAGDYSPMTRKTENDAQGQVMAFERAKVGFKRIRELLAKSHDVFGWGGAIKSAASEGSQQWASLQSFFSGTPVAPPAWSDDFETRKQGLRSAVGGLTSELIKDISGLATTNAEYKRLLETMTGIKAELDNPQIDFDRAFVVRFKTALDEYQDLLSDRADVSRAGLRDGVPLTPANPAEDGPDPETMTPEEREAEKQRLLQELNR